MITASRPVLGPHSARFSRALDLVRSGIFRTSAGMVANQALNVGLNLVLVAILTRCLSLHDMGRYQLVLALIAFGQVAGLPGMDVVINKAVIKKFDGLVLPALKASFICALAGCVAICVAGTTLFVTGWNREIGQSMLLISLFIPMKGLEKYDAILLGKREFALTRRLNTFASILSIVTMGPVAYFTGAMEAVVLTLFIVKGATVALGLKLAMRRLEAQEVSVSQRDSLLRQGWNQTFFNIIGIGVTQVDKVILGLMEPRLLAIYYMGCIIPARIKDNAKAIFGVVTTHWSAESKEVNLEKIKRNSKYILLLGLALSGITCASAPVLIPALCGQEYRQSIAVSQMLSIGLCLNFYTYFFATMDVYQNRGRAWNMQNTVRQAVYLGLLAVLLPRYSIYGVVFATLAADFMNAAMSFKQFRTKTKSRANQNAEED